MKRTWVVATGCTNQRLGMIAAVICLAFATSALATLANETLVEGRLDFEAAKLPAANLEMDLSQDTFRSLFGISDAAIAGVAESLFKSGDGEADKSKRLSAEQLDAIRKIVELGGKFVREVRLRVYQGLPDETDDVQTLFKPFDAQLKNAKWETIVRFRDGEDMARVCVLHKDGALRGLFVTATDGDGVLLVNVVCDVSPDKVKPLTAAITKIGMSVDFQPVITWTSSLASGDDDSPTGLVMQSAAYASPPATPVPGAPKAAEKAVPKPVANVAPKTVTKATGPAAAIK
jgi:hypothetical protein